MKYEHFEDIWSKNPIIIFDTNVLLRLYEYSPETGNFLIDTINSICENIYLPSFVLKEFNKHHLSSREGQRKKYTSLSRKIAQATAGVNTKILKQIDILEEFKFSDVEELREQCLEKLDEIDEIFEEYVEEHQVLEEINSKYLNEDKIGQLVELCKTNQRVSNKLTLGELYDIYTEGEMRFKYNLPPGCKDSKKKELDQYGDLVIWKQVIELSKITSRDVVFVTDDVKRDWWEKSSTNELIALHDSLFEEFNGETGKEVLGLTANMFYEYLGLIKRIDYPSKVQQIISMSSDDYINSIISDPEFEYSILDLVTEDIEEFNISGENPDFDFLYDVESIEIVEFLDYTTEFGHDEETVYSTEFNVIIEALRVKVLTNRSGEYNHEPCGRCTLKGVIQVKFSRIVDSDISSIQLDDYDFEHMYIEEGHLELYEIIPQHEICSECNKNQGIYVKWNGSMICNKCYISTDDQTCPDCGRIVPTMNMGGNGFCSDCAPNH